jgi:tetratricopeptide (TPR) repeat protein
MIDKDVREGYILTPFFNEQLALYEKQPESMKLFFPEMVRALNVRHEIKRLAGVQFTKETAEPTPVKTAAPPPEPPSSRAAQTAIEADAYYAKQDLSNARRLYQLALEQPGSSEDHSKAYFGLAHVALLQHDPETADQLFRKTLESSPDADRKAWSCYYLGKLSDAAQEHDEAVKWYQKAVSVEGAPPKAVESARRGLEKPAPAPVEK